MEDEIKIEYKETMDKDPLDVNVLETDDEESLIKDPLATLVSELEKDETVEKISLDALVSEIVHAKSSENYPPPTYTSEIDNEESEENDHSPVHITSSKSGIKLPNIPVPFLGENEAAHILQDKDKTEVSDDSEEDDSGYTLDSVDVNTSHYSANWYKKIDGYGKLICNFCDRAYSVITSLRYHVTLKHPEKVGPVKKNILQKRRTSQPTCHLCKKRFISLTDLKTHTREHTIQNVYSCHHCNAAFINNQELVEHLNNYHNVVQNKRHVCDTCGYRTHKLSHYKQHIDTHSTEKRNKCAFCDYATNNKSNLKNHERIHKNDRPFVCDFNVCGKRFSDVTGLNYHMQKHYPERNTLYCDKCSYRTVYKQSLKVHIESHTRK
ncbi:zinc finger protein 62 homolog isoform X2 [Plodia interpunctella]|uniref:zinc finger protein 62 homolog isoform X2 n=1 Tax=Plodia interpunctella TaxID=58824 RepID=UPI002367608C|nr:zinc finger protein 62 homolog isoform X2 [Plodia interpunctella]